jgi:APA family basic amino acid/polyamine antiporter
VLTVVLVWGIRESANFNAGMVAIKIIVLLFFVGAALYFVPPGKMVENWHPFRPQGWGGTFAGAALVFFAYIGFDAVSTVAEETKNPARDLPIGIIGSLIVCTIFYVVVAAVFTGMIPFPELQKVSSSGQAEALTMALDYVAPSGVTLPQTIVAFGSVVAHTAVFSSWASRAFLCPWPVMACSPQSSRVFILDSRRPMSPQFSPAFS